MNKGSTLESLIQIVYLRSHKERRCRGEYLINELIISIQNDDPHQRFCNELHLAIMQLTNQIIDTKFFTRNHKKQLAFV